MRMPCSSCSPVVRRDLEHGRHPQARPTAIWSPASGSAPPPPTATSARRWSCRTRWRHRGRQLAIEVARGKAYVILDGTLLRIDRVAMSSGRDRPFYAGKHTCQRVNVQVIADPAGRLIWASPACPARGTTWAPPASTASSRPSTPPGCKRWPTPPPGRRPRGTRAAASPSPGYRHRPLPAAVAQPAGGQHRARPPARPRRTSQRRAEELEDLHNIRASPSRTTTLVQAVQPLILVG